jgi:hypothetical protein
MCPSNETSTLFKHEILVKLCVYLIAHSRTSSFFSDNTYPYHRLRSRVWLNHSLVQNEQESKPRHSVDFRSLLMLHGFEISILPIFYDSNRIHLN